MELVKVVDYTRLYTGKDGKEYPSTTYFLHLEKPNGDLIYIAIKPHFDKNARDWLTLDNYASRVVKGEKPTK